MVDVVADVGLSSMERIISDSNASYYHCNKNNGLYNYAVRNDNMMITDQKEELHCETLQKNGERIIIALEDVKYVPDLYSIVKASKNGFDIGNEG
jgi:hypothetical protein